MAASKQSNDKTTIDGKVELDFFEGLGHGVDIPKYLRYDGRIPNRRILEEDLQKLIKDIWEAKSIFDRYNSEKSTYIHVILFYIS